MFAGENEQAFLPVWRNGQLIFFTNISTSGSSRINYFAAATSVVGQNQIKRTGKAPISSEQLAFCQGIFDDPVTLQKFFAHLGSGNLGDFASLLSSAALPCDNNTSPLIYTCLYLDFLRKYAVDSEVIRLYADSPAKQRFRAERSVGIYKILSSRLQSKDANALIDADIGKLKKIPGSSLSVANLLRECAMIKGDLGKFDDAEQFMLRAVKMHDTEDKWRRLADFADAAGDREKAIRYFSTAHKSKPLPAPAALVMARHLLADGQYQAAKEFAKLAEPVFKKPVAVLLEKIDAAIKE